jgi:hypothetical protein
VRDQKVLRAVLIEVRESIHQSSRRCVREYILTKDSSDIERCAERLSDYKASGRRSSVGGKDTTGVAETPAVGRDWTAARWNRSSFGGAANTGWHVGFLTRQPTTQI